jgi:hypothetical protein
MVSLARALARSCRRPGAYAVILVVPERRDAPFVVQVGRVEKIGSGE